MNFIDRLDAIHAKRKAIEEEAAAIYNEAARSIDVHALKATMNCRHGCVDRLLTVLAGAAEAEFS